MPTYTVTDPNTGRKKTLTGDSLPTVQELQQIFSQVNTGLSEVDLDVPTKANMDYLAEQSKANKEQLGAKDYISGAADALMTMGTAATAGGLGYLAGGAEGIAGELTGSIPSGEGHKRAEALAAQNTWTPRTKVGADIIKWIGEKFGVLPPFMGITPLQMAHAARSAGVRGKTAFKTAKKPYTKIKLNKQDRNKIKSALADEIAAGNINAGNIAYTLDQDGLLITNQNTRKALSLIDEKDPAYSMAINLEKMNNSTRKYFNKMLDTLVENKKSGDATVIMDNRPANVVGEALQARVLELDRIRKKQGAKINELIKGKLGKEPINVSSAVNKFITDLEQKGVIIGAEMGEDGLPIYNVNTSRSSYNFNEVITGQKIANYLNDLSRNATGENVHNIKRIINENLNYDRQAIGTAKMSGDVESIFKGFAGDLNELLRSKSPEYKKANAIFSDVIKPLTTADKMIGNKLFIGDGDKMKILVDKKLGSLAKRFGTNLASKEQVELLVDTLDEALKKRSKKVFDDDVRKQVAALADLERVFKVETEQAPFGFTSGIQSAMVGAATGSPSAEVTRLGIDTVLKKFTTMSQKDFNDKIKALRAMSRQK